MELLTLILCVIPTIVTSISVSSNGNSPKIRMIGGMMMDSQKGFTPMKQPVLETTTKSNHDKSRKLDLASKLSINERYRRLIPYMTFYYANDIAPTTEPHTHRDVEVEKAEIVEAAMVDRQPKKIIYSPRRNVPRYQGNRLTQFNIASANPVKVYYKPVPSYQNYGKVTPNYNPLVQEYVAVNNNEYEDNRFGQRQVFRVPSPPLVQTTTRRPTVNVYNQEDPTNPPYYIPERQQAAKFKLIPYEQAQPIKVVNRPENVYDSRNPIPVPVLIPNDPVYIKPRPIRPQYNYDNVNYQQVNVRKVPTIVSENYYERPEEELAPAQPLTEPVIEDGFKPIVAPTITTEAPIYTTALPPVHVRQYVSPKKPVVQIVQSVPPEVTSYRPDYYQYEVDQPSYNTEEYAPPQTVTLSDLLNSLQLNKSIPKPITRENVGSSIRTLLQVLNTLKAMSQNEVEVPVLSTPKPFVSTTVVPLESMTPKSIGVPPVAIDDDVDLPEEPYLAPVHTPSQHLDDTPHPGGTSQRFPAVTHNGEEGGTPGRPGVDYPALTVIPHTAFDCKTQRYKGFFADTETRCQVWHYCDLNGGQASFLCPNGTIFSQAALTCDWWFNVRCASTTQLYVLNESLYKYILPHSPKFPEDYSGPLVDKYLTLKFKEMEEQFKKNKKQKASEKSDSEEDDSSEESDEKDEDESVKSEENDRSETSDVVSEVSAVSEASVLVESPGTSGNVERLQV